MTLCSPLRAWTKVRRESVVMKARATVGKEGGDGGGGDNDDDASGGEIDKDID